MLLRTGTNSVRNCSRDTNSTSARFLAARECRKAPCAANQGHARGNGQLEPDSGYTGHAGRPSAPIPCGPARTTSHSHHTHDQSALPAHARQSSTGNAAPSGTCDPYSRTRWWPQQCSPSARCRTSCSSPSYQCCSSYSPSIGWVLPLKHDPVANKSEE